MPFQQPQYIQVMHNFSYQQKYGVAFRSLQDANRVEPDFALGAPGYVETISEDVANL